MPEQTSSGTVNFRAKLISGYLLKSRRKNGGTPCTVLTLAFMRDNGDPIDVKTFRRKKAWVVYRKVKFNRYYLVTDVTLKPADEKFSPCRFEGVDGPHSWKVEEIPPFDIQGRIASQNSLQDAIEILGSRGCTNVVAKFRGYSAGPIRHIGAWPAARGYYVEVTDSGGKNFRVLVWHRIERRQRRPELFDFEAGDWILFYASRPSFVTHPGTHQPYTLTSSFPPVANSPCVSSKRTNYAL